MHGKFRVLGNPLSPRKVETVGCPTGMPFKILMPKSTHSPTASACTGDFKHSRKGPLACPGSPLCAVLKKPFLHQVTAILLAQLLPWILQTTLSEQQQELLPFRGPLGFSCWQARAQHHSVFQTWQQRIPTREMMRTTRAMMETTTKMVMTCF